ncbi:MAG: PLP-dependent transferase [Candidatus Eremiobacteraeota bacterium]|nr:PLP-dependent transferase [Candidatus Eremiobacteraeota bacterium]
MTVNPETAVVRAGGSLSIPSNAPSSPPLFQASSYTFADLEDVEAVYGGTRPGRIYGRYGAPNGTLFEAAMAELEEAEDAVGAASGMAAIHAALAAHLGVGDRIVASRELYGGTHELFERDFQQNRFSVTYVDQENLEAVRAALTQERPRILYLEALTNPLLHVANLPALATLARESGAISVVDATFATPVLVQPAMHGIDLVVHSAGKYLGGHGDVGAGVVAGPRALIEPIRVFLMRTGATIAHFEAWLALRGLRTLALRMERHCTNAAMVAAYLQGSPAVETVHHPSLPHHLEYRLAADLYPRGTGGIVAFDLRGGRAAVSTFLSALQHIEIVHSLGQYCTTVSYSVAGSHRMVSAEVREQLGVRDGTLRLSVGIEHIDDIIADLHRGLSAAATLRVPRSPQGFADTFAED